MSFLVGCALTFVMMMMVLNLNPGVLYVPFEMTRKALETLGAM